MLLLRLRRKKSPRVSHWPRLVLLAVVLLLLLAVSTADETQLVLIDGSVLSGTDVRREDGTYVLTLEEGDRVTIPEQLVETVRLVGRPKKVDERNRGLIAGDPIPPGPTGLRSEGPETLAGVPVEPPRTSEQLRALGPPARFQKNIIDPTWRPESAWDEGEDVLAASRSTWAEDIIDPGWQPESAWDADEDVLAGSRSTWSKSIVDSTWTPTDGFATSVGRR
jgi:hypothetical protein